MNQPWIERWIQGDRANAPLFLQASVIRAQALRSSLVAYEDRYYNYDDVASMDWEDINTLRLYYGKYDNTKRK